MKLARRAGSSSARRALVEPASSCKRGINCKITAAVRAQIKPCLLCFCRSFLSNTSFIAFASLGSRPEVRLSLDLKCRASTGIVLFNSGRPLYADFIAVELADGRVKLRVNKGAGDVTMTSRAPVNDAQWHQVSERLR